VSQIQTVIRCFVNYLNSSYSNAEFLILGTFFFYRRVILGTYVIVSQFYFLFFIFYFLFFIFKKHCNREIFGFNARLTIYSKKNVYSFNNQHRSKENCGPQVKTKKLPDGPTLGDKHRKESSLTKAICGYIRDQDLISPVKAQVLVSSQKMLRMSIP
jgi:hypothetical protein